MWLRRVTLSLAVIAISSPAFAVSLLLNGSFENGSYTFSSGGGGQNVPVGDTSIADWTVFNDGVAAISSSNGFGFSAEQGDVSLDLQDYSDPDSALGGVEQAIPTQVGATYALDFYVGSIGGTTSVSASAGGVAIGTGSSIFVSGDTWTESTFDFTAASTTTNIQLLGTVESSAYIGLDNVSVTFISGPPTSVPLPVAAYGGVALIGILGAAKWLRKAAQSA